MNEHFNYREIVMLDGKHLVTVKGQTKGKMFTTVWDHENATELDSWEVMTYRLKSLSNKPK